MLCPISILPHLHQTLTGQSSSSTAQRATTDSSLFIKQVPDAVVCINKLASLGSQACVANAVAFFWTHGRAQVVGVAGPVAYVSTTCQKVAQTAGKIMDQCTSGQFTGGQIPNLGDSRMQVHLRLP